MTNRNDPFDLFHEKEPESQPKEISVEVKPGERLLHLVLEMEDEAGLLEDQLPEGFEGERFIEQELLIREREYKSFVKVLHYNNINYRLKTLL